MFPGGVRVDGGAKKRTINVCASPYIPVLIGLVSEAVAHTANSESFNKVPTYY